jgi:hypothetical protein
MYTLSEILNKLKYTISLKSILIKSITRFKLNKRYSQNRI